MTNTYWVYTVLRYSWWWKADRSETCRVFYQINLRNTASRWLLLQEYIAMHGPLNIKVPWWSWNFIWSHTLSSLHPSLFTHLFIYYFCLRHAVLECAILLGKSLLIQNIINWKLVRHNYAHPFCNTFIFPISSLQLNFEFLKLCLTLPQTTTFRWLIAT
jgi:hypothetical protein